ncbi:hypothetical protein RHSIM_Rhsim10G0123200 [Rhododendron simsii]|uniref:Aminotransferase-like plant mobile domain-containing protein n=1 Tax=Rhododendron simsii TaxID=118357 RepID=A0A834G995_RHOSS|nr:hypothetical protein RHSIM_Rhsim10G0123200 [Rhododendron simsii]
MVDALRRSVRREKGHNGVKNTFTEWARYWYKDLGASKAGEEAHVVTDGPGLKKPAHLAAFLAYWLTWYIFPGPPKDGVDTTLFELAAILASGESVPLAPLFLGTLFKRLGMLQDAARRSCGSYDFGASNSGGRGEPCRNVCRSARWSRSGIRGVRGSIADVLDVEGEFVARPYVNTLKGVFPFNVYSEEDVVTFANKDDASTAELFRMSCMMLGELPYFVNGRYGSVMYDPMRVARQFRFDQGVPKPRLLSGDAGDVWKRFLKSAFPAELRSMNTITLPGAKRMGGCTKLYREYWRDNLVRFLDYVKKVPMSLGVEDVMSQDGELCLLKVKDPVLASFGARSPYVKEEVLGRVKEHLETIYGTGEKDGGSSASLSDRAGEGRAEEVRLSGKHTSKRPAKDVAEVAQPSKRKKTTKGNKESADAVQPGVAEEVIRTPRVEIPETETGGGSEVPSTSVEVISTLDQHAAAHGGMDDIWGDEGVSSGRVPQPDVVEEVRKTRRVEVSEMAAGGGLDVPLDSLEAIGTFDQNVAAHGVMNEIWGDEGGSSQGVAHPWKGKSLHHMRSAARYPDGSVIVTLETKEKVTLQPSVLFTEAREEHRPLLSDIFFSGLVPFLPKATPEEFISIYDGLAALGSYQLEVDWLRKRIDQMVFLIELPAWRDRLEKVSKELKEVQATAARLRKRKKKLEGEVVERESALSRDFDMSSHAGQGPAVLWQSTRAGQVGQALEGWINKPPIRLDLGFPERGG